MTSIDALRARYIEERPHYEAIAQKVRDGLEARAVTSGLWLRYDHRAKDVPSLVKKALVKRLDYEAISDKAGARVIYAYRWEREILESHIVKEFVILDRVDMSDKLEPHELGYLGVHYDVQLQADQARAFPVKPRCEIQLHTWQQNTWASYSHELLYKSQHAAPPRVARSLLRLLAMVEIFDQEVNAARDLLLEGTDFGMAKVIDRLEREFFRHTGRGYDRELTRSILETLLPLYSERNVEAVVTQFVNDHVLKLERVYSIYRDDPRATPLLFQPEAILLLAALEEMPTKVMSSFAGVAPLELLQELALAWGDPLD